MGKLEERIALVTGGTSGIGLAAAKAFVEEGAHVYITGRRHRELQSAVRDIGRQVTAIQSDVAVREEVDRMVAQIEREQGRLDVIFANAGVAAYARLGQITEEIYDAIFDVNVKGMLFTVQQSLPLLTDGASIILNASIAGSRGFPANSIYNATKAAVRSFARSWTTDLKARRIRVNAISPGAIDTPGLSNLAASSSGGSERLQMMASVTPLGRLGRPEEIARTVLFLASEDSSYIAGAELFVDGGFAQV